MTPCLSMMTRLSVTLWPIEVPGRMTESSTRLPVSTRTSTGLEVYGNVRYVPAGDDGSEPRALATVGGTVPAIRPEHTALIGIRNLDEREKDRIRAAGVHVLTMKDIDREGMAKQLLKGTAVAAHGLQAPCCPAYDPNFKDYPYDPAQAKKLLAEAA